MLCSSHARQSQLCHCWQVGSQLLVVPTQSDGGSVGIRAGRLHLRDRLGSAGDGSGRDGAFDQRYAM